jgi:nitrate/nitrite transport system permease protein
MSVSEVTALVPTSVKPPATAAPTASTVTGTSPPAPRPPAAPKPRKRRAATSRLRSTGSALGFGLFGIGLFVGLWAIGAALAPDLPTPIEGWNALTELLANPFYNGGPADQGIALQLGASLGRVLRGFALAVVVGVPLGMLMGASRRAWQTANPVVQVLRPVSPLAWFPIGLVIFQDSPNAAVFVIFVTALWPIVLNTATGASSVPVDQRNVARIFQFSRLTYLRHVLFPQTVPSMITGLRLSMGTAWMVIVAVEMLSGGSGIGFYVWDSYNAGNLANVIAAIVLIGLVGFALDSVFVRLGRHFAPAEATR